MKLLVIGSGGREHALAWRLAQSEKVSKVFVAPGNGGTALDEKLENIDIKDIHALADFAVHEHIHFTVVGPEAPLASGIVDAFQEKKLRIFGPRKAAAQLESSKDFAKAFMIRHGIPTATYQTFTEANAAHDYINQKGAPIVVKADGLAAGKGVVVAQTIDEAHQAIDWMLNDKSLGEAGGRVVIEECLLGEEASFIVLADGTHALALASSQDHKRLLDGDFGPNTGGMGAYSPAPVVTPSIHAKVMREVIMPTIQGMRKEGIVYTGFLYAGLMISPDGDTKVLEFNCRMGDPEAQPILMRLKSDLHELIDHAIDGTLNQVEAQWDRRCALGVVLAARGYPEAPIKGDLIKGDFIKGNSIHEKPPIDSKLFYAGTLQTENGLVTSGGRVMCATALGDNIKQAQSKAYELAQLVEFEGMQMRHDIGHRALARK